MSVISSEEVTQRLDHFLMEELKDLDMIDFRDTNVVFTSEYSMDVSALFIIFTTKRRKPDFIPVKTRLHGVDDRSIATIASKMVDSMFRAINQETMKIK